MELLACQPLHRPPEGSGSPGVAAPQRAGVRPPRL